MDSSDSLTMYSSATCVRVVPFKRANMSESEYSVSNMRWSPSGRYLVYISNETRGASSVQVAALRPPPQLHDESVAAPVGSESAAAATSSASGPEATENRRLEVVERFEPDCMSAHSIADADPEYRVHWTCASVGESVYSTSRNERLLLLVILATCADSRGYSSLLLLRWLEPRSTTTVLNSSASGSSASTKAIGQRFMCDISKRVRDAVALSDSVAFGDFGDCWLAPDASRGLVKLGPHSVFIDALLNGEAKLAVRQTKLEGTSTALFSTDARLLVLTGITKKNSLTRGGRPPNTLDQTLSPAFVLQKKNEHYIDVKCCLCFKVPRVKSSSIIARVASISSSSQMATLTQNSPYSRYYTGLYAIDIDRQRMRQLVAGFCTDICFVDQRSRIDSDKYEYTVIVLLKPHEQNAVPQIRICTVTPTELMCIVEVTFETGFSQDTFPDHLRPSRILLHREANQLYVFAAETALPDACRSRYARGNRGEDDSTAVRFVIFSLETLTCSEPRVLQIDQYAHTTISTLLLHPSLPLLAGFPLSLVPLASATQVASAPPDDAASAVTSSSEQQSSPLLDAIQALPDVPFAAVAPISSPSTSAYENNEQLEFIDAVEMLGLSDTTHTL